MELVTFIFDRKITLEAFHTILVPIIKKHMKQNHVFSISLDTDDGKIMNWYLESNDYPNILYRKDTDVYTQSYLMNTHLVVFSMFTGKNRRPNKIIKRLNCLKCTKMSFEKTDHGNLYTKFKDRLSISNPSFLRLAAILERKIYKYMKDVYNDEDIDIRVLLDDQTIQNQILAINMWIDGELTNMDLYPYWVAELINRINM